jgi:hypothetical protein
MKDYKGIIYATSFPSVCSQCTGEWNGKRITTSIILAVHLVDPKTVLIETRNSFYIVKRGE